MKKIILGVIIILVSCRSEDKKSISLLFEELKIYESNKECNKLFELANQNTSEYFNNIKNISLTADSTYLRKINTYDKLLVLQIRGKYSFSELDTMSTKQLFIDYFNDALSLKSVIMDRVIKNISINGLEAKGEVNSKMIPYSKKQVVKFTKEENKWKYDFPSYFDINRENIDDFRKTSSESDDEYLKGVLMLKGIRKSYLDLWSPMKN